MRINRDLLLIKILQFKPVFYKLLDEVENNGGSYEVKEQVYLELYNNEIVTSDDEKAHIWLSMDCLIDNGIFVHHDKRNNSIVLQSFLIDMLRFIDIKRARELSATDFENIRVQMQKLHSALLECGGYGTEKYFEIMVSFNELMSDTLSKIKRNTETLFLQANTIGDLYSSLDENSTDKVTANDLYDMIQKLFYKYVIPCQEFMDPNMQMQGKGVHNYSEYINFFMRYHADNNQHQVSADIGFRKTAIMSHYKDIKEILDNLSVYHQFLESDRKSYLAIESAYNELKGSVEELRHGKNVNKYLSSNLPIFKNINSFDGISNHKANQSQKINWYQEFTKIHFEEWQRTKTSTKAEVVVNLTPMPINISEDKLRREKIILLSMYHDFPENIGDVHMHLADWLKREIDDYQLFDLIIAVSVFLTSRTKSKIKYHREKNKVDDGKYYINYLRISV
jgi:hypothetical protein